MIYTSSHNKPMLKARAGFTLVEVLLVVVIMGILASVVIPQFVDSSDDAKTNTTKFDLRTLRSQILLYQSHHNWEFPSANWRELLSTTNAQGQVGVGREYPHGPYFREIPQNTITGSNTIVVITNNPAQAGDVTSAGGWLYHPASGGVWINHEDFYLE